MSENQKCLNLIRGGGGQAYLGIFPKFFRFFMMAPLKSSYTAEDMDIIWKKGLK